MKEKKFYVFIIITADLIFPALVNFCLAYFICRFEGDILAETAVSVLSAADRVLSPAVFFVAFAVLVNSLLRRKINGYPYKFAVAAYIFYILTADVYDFIAQALNMIYYTDILPSFLIYYVMSVLTRVVIFLAAAIICSRTVKRFKIKNSVKKIVPRVLLFCSAVLLAVNFIQNTMDVLMSDVAEGAADVLFRYLSIILYAVLGYAVMLAVSLMFNKKTIKGEDNVY